MRSAPVVVACLLCLAADVPSTQPTLDQQCRSVADTWKQRFALEHMASIVSPPFVVAGDGGDVRVNRYLNQTIRAAADAMQRKYFDDAKPDKPIVILLFESDEPYRRLAKQWFGDEDISRFGYFRHDNVMLMNVGTGTGTLVHELTHALIKPDFPQVPAWFNEGLGSLFEQCTLSGGDIRGLVNWRLPDLQRAIRKDELRSIEGLAKDEDFYGHELVGINYAQARYLLMYLQETSKLQSYYKLFRDKHAEDPTGLKQLQAVIAPQSLDDFEADWRRWVLRQRFEESAGSRDDVDRQMTLDEAIKLGRAALTRGDIALAESTARQILRQVPTDLRAIDLLGNVALRQGAFELAARIFSKALEFAPNGAELHYNLAIALLRKPDFALAETHFRRALELSLDHPHVHAGLSEALKALGKTEAAIVHAQRAVELDPKSAPLWLNLGKSLMERGDFPQIETAFRRAIEADPLWEESSTRFAGLLWSAGQPTESNKVLRDFLAIQPNAPQAHRRLLFHLNYTPGLDPGAVFQEHLAFAEKYETPYRDLTRPPRVARTKIRIGFVSSDFHGHAVAHFLFSLLSTIDRNRFEVFCYATLTKIDLLTHRYREQADHWVDITQQSDDQAADRIRADGIDCLIDLGGHSPGARLLIFARKPAPAKITWLGYLGTTGLRAMDFRITDPYLETEQAAKFYTETPLMLPKTYWCYDLLNDPPAIEQRDADIASITFASLSSFGKYAPGVLATWAELLSRVRGSRLILHSHYRGVEESVMAPFLARGIERGRVEFVATQPLDDYLKTYNRIDVALDPFPYGGGTTTCGALWMGVPVVTLAGDAPSSRTGVSILSNVGRPELIASTTDEYIEAAIAAAHKVGEYRRTMRERMSKSPLMDAPAFARDFGDAVIRALS